MYPGYNYLGKREKCEEIDVAFPMQHQDCQPGIEGLMKPKPISEITNYVGSNKLRDKVVLITGGDSGIGRAIAYLFAKEGAKIAIVYLYERDDAMETKRRVEEIGAPCLVIETDLNDRKRCDETIDKIIECYGGLDILINNHGVQFVEDSILDITDEQLALTFQTNIISYFYLVRASLPHLKCGSSIINTTSITAYEGEKRLLDYSATKGAVVSFTRSLSQSLMAKGIRVNAVAPGPVWTPLIPSSFSDEEVSMFGTETSKVPMNRAAQPFEIAPSYLFLASNDSRYMSGQVLHPNGGVITGS